MSLKLSVHGDMLSVQRIQGWSIGCCLVTIRQIPCNTTEMVMLMSNKALNVHYSPLI